MSGSEVLALTMIVMFIALVFTGYPIAWILGGLAALFTALAIIFQVDFAITTNVDWFYTSMSVDRMWDIMENWVMVALPMFIFMGILLDRAGIARDLLTGFSWLLGGVRGGLAITVTIIGVLLAASRAIGWTIRTCGSSGFLRAAPPSRSTATTGTSTTPRASTPLSSS